MTKRFIGLISEGCEKPFMYISDTQNTYSIRDIFFYALLPHQARIEIRTMDAETAQKYHFTKIAFTEIKHGNIKEAYFQDLWDYARPHTM